MEDKKCSSDIRLQSSSCSARLLASLATSPFEERSAGEQSRVAEHAKTCSACSAVLAQEQRAEEIIRAFTSPTRYPDEPELHFSSLIQRLREQEQQTRDVKRQEKRQRHLRWPQHRPIALFCGTVLLLSVVLIVCLPEYGSAITTILIVVQCLIMALPLIQKEKEGKSKEEIKK